MAAGGGLFIADDMDIDDVGAGPPSQWIFKAVNGERVNERPRHLPKRNKKGRLIGEPKVPKARHDRCNTEYYKRYVRSQHARLLRDIRLGKFNRSRSYKPFDDYYLFSDSTITPSEVITKIPQRGVRLDDFAIGLVLQHGYSAEELNEKWPADFDTKGMVKAERVPLGHAVKVWVSAGDRDVDGYTATPEQAGWYYGWWGGIHVLMGKEGHDRGLYLIRPSHEDFECDGFGFKLTHKARVQRMY